MLKELGSLIKQVNVKDSIPKYLKSDVLTNGEYGTQRNLVQNIFILKRTRNVIEQLFKNHFLVFSIFYLTPIMLEVVMVMLIVGLTTLRTLSNLMHVFQVMDNRVGLNVKDWLSIDIMLLHDSTVLKLDVLILLNLYFLLDAKFFFSI